MLAFLPSQFPKGHDTFALSFLGGTLEGKKNCKKPLLDPLDSFFKSSFFRFFLLFGQVGFSKKFDWRVKHVHARGSEGMITRTRTQRRRSSGTLRFDASSVAAPLQSKTFSLKAHLGSRLRLRVQQAGMLVPLVLGTATAVALGMAVEQCILWFWEGKMWSFENDRACSLPKEDQLSLRKKLWLDGSISAIFALCSLSFQSRGAKESQWSVLPFLQHVAFVGIPVVICVGAISSSFYFSKPCEEIKLGGLRCEHTMVLFGAFSNFLVFFMTEISYHFRSKSKFRKQPCSKRALLRYLLCVCKAFILIVLGFCGSPFVMALVSYVTDPVKEILLFGLGYPLFYYLLRTLSIQLVQLQNKQAGGLDSSQTGGREVVESKLEVYSMIAIFVQLVSSIPAFLILLSFENMNVFFASACSSFFTEIALFWLILKGQRVQRRAAAFASVQSGKVAPSSIRIKGASSDASSEKESALDLKSNDNRDEQNIEKTFTSARLGPSELLLAAKLFAEEIGETASLFYAILLAVVIFPNPSSELSMKVSILAAIEIIADEAKFVVAELAGLGGALKVEYAVGGATFYSIVTIAASILMTANFGRSWSCTLA